MNTLHVELDSPHACVRSTLLFDQLQPLVVDASRIELRRREPGSTAQVVVPREPRFVQDGVYGTASATAVGGMCVVHQRLGAMQAARNRKRSRSGSFASGGLGRGHGEWVWLCAGFFSWLGAWHEAPSPWRRAWTGRMMNRIAPSANTTASIRDVVGPGRRAKL